MNIGKLLRTFRVERKMSLKELSKKSKVAMATLSRMEHGTMTGTLESHMNICKALGISLVDFYRGIENDTKSVSFIRQKEKHDAFVYAKKSSLELLVNKVMDKKMMPALLHLSVGGEMHKEENKAGSEKFVYLMTGDITAIIAKDKYEMKKGDGLYFDASLPHSFKNNGKREAVAMCILTPPEF